MKRNESGYNLIEVVFATALLGIVSITIFTLFVMGRRNVYSGKQNSQAVAIATQVMEDFQPLNKKMIYNGAFGILDTDWLNGQRESLKLEHLAAELDCTDLRLRPGTQSLGQGSAHLDAPLGGTLCQGLCVGIGDDELHPFEAAFDHIVDRVSAGAADAEHGNMRLELGKIGHGEIDCHDWRPQLISPAESLLPIR